MSDETMQRLREKLEEILAAKPTDKDVPESIWNDIHPTFTGLWTDSYGEWDEQQASDLFPVSDLLSDDREAWLKSEILQALAAEIEPLKVDMHVSGYYPYHSHLERTRRT
jgi:hypothetical protein